MKFQINFMETVDDVADDADVLAVSIGRTKLSWVSHVTLGCAFNKR